MKQHQITTVILILCLLITACQPTPEVTPVIQKTLEPFTPASITEADGAYAAPSYLKTTSKMPGNLTISVQAPVDIAMKNGFPVAVLSRRPVTNKEAADVLSALGYWREVYLVPETYSRSELETYLLRMEQQGVPETYSEEEFNRIMQTLKAEIKAAPSEVEKVAFDPYAWAEKDDELPPIVIEDEAGQQYALTLSDGDLIFSRANILVQQQSLMEEPISPQSIKISEQEAMARGEALLKTLDIENMTLSLIEPARILESPPVPLEPACLSYGYWLCFMREMHGLATPYIGRSVGGRIGYAPDYAAPWRQERVDVYIDETGIQFLSLISRCDIRSVLTQNATLLPFETIQQRMLDQLRYKHIWNQGELPPLIDVYHIRLGLSIVQIPNTQDGVYLMPTWYIYYHLIREESTREDVIALSGLDGGCIEPRISTAILSQVNGG